MSAFTAWFITFLLSFNEPPSPGFARVVLRNDRGQKLIIQPQPPHRCTIEQAEHASITWRCSGPTEFVRQAERHDDVYYWQGGGAEGLGSVTGGVIGGDWRVFDKR
jgi:hypothetical protein